MSFFLMLNTREDILENVGNKLLLAAIDVHSMKKNIYTVL